jgi:porphyrinogen peroxidase
MLENMFVGKPPGNYDRLLDFSRAVTGTLFFVPSATFLEDVAAGPAASTSIEGETAAQSEPHASQPEGSLGIGSLKKEAGRE